MIRVVDDRLEVVGAMTLPHAAALMGEGAKALAGGVQVVDLAEVTEVDSSAIAVLFAWLREARAQTISLRIAHPPADMLSLAHVYGVGDLLPLA